MNNNNVLLTGGTGFVGGAVLSNMPGARLLGRHQPKGFQGTFIRRGFGPELDYSDCFDGIDVVIHCAARVHVMKEQSQDPLKEFRSVNTEGTLNFARQAAENGVRRFIFVSSIKVNGESTVEGKAFCSSDDRKPEDDYGISKAEAEVLLEQLSRKTNMDVVIIRPPLVYGPGVKANFASLLNLVRREFPLPFGCLNHNQRSLVFVDNLVDLVLECVDNPSAANQVFLVSDGEDLSTAQMVKYMGRALGKPARMIPVPLWCFLVAAKILGKEQMVKRLTGFLHVDITHTKQTLNWQPPYSLEYGFAKTADSFLKYK